MKSTQSIDQEKTDFCEPDCQQVESLQPYSNCLTLRQKMSELRKACSALHDSTPESPGENPNLTLRDAWAKLSPKMSELGVDFDVEEYPVCSAVFGNTSALAPPSFYTMLLIKTEHGNRPSFLYESRLTLRWSNLDNEDEILSTTVCAVGWHLDPTKAKMHAISQAIFTYLLERFGIGGGIDDLDSSELLIAAPERAMTEYLVQQLYGKATGAGMSKEQTDARIHAKYKKSGPAELSTCEYSEICSLLDNAAAKGGKQDAQ